MHLIDILVAILSALLLLPIFRFVQRSVRAYRSTRLLLDECAGCCEDISFIGCSAICCGEYDLLRLQRLLAVEYDRYELIVVVDSHSNAALVEQIISYFRLVRVNPVANIAGGEPIRALYRSRPHHFYRLVLVDVRSVGVYDDLNVALSVASYDYLLPLRSDVVLDRHAIEALMITVAESEHSVDLLSVASCPSVWLFGRYATEQAGGFSEDILANDSFSHRITIYAPVIYCFHPSGDALLRLCLLLSVLFFGVLYLSLGGLWALVVAASFASLYAVATYHTSLLYPANSLKVTLLCYFNHIASFFYLQKFRL